MPGRQLFDGQRVRMVGGASQADDTLQCAEEHGVGHAESPWTSSYESVGLAVIEDEADKGVPGCPLRCPQGSSLARFNASKSVTGGLLQCPEGAKQDSPGQRPGKGRLVSVLALKGRNNV